MSDETAAAAETASETTGSAEQNGAVTLPDDHPLVRTLAAQKEQIKELRAKAQKLDEIEESSKTEAQKLAERAEKAEQALTALQSDALRAQVALEKGLTPTQAKRLIGSTRDELEADADELLKDLGETAKPRAPKPDPTQGRQSGGAASTADQFAATVGGLL